MRLKDIIAEARDLLNSQDFGVLSTISVKLKGIPFGSVVPYCVDKDGKPVVLISHIAEHTFNISSDSRSSITILNYDQQDVSPRQELHYQERWKLSIMKKTEVQSKYYRYFPNSTGFNTVHDFSF